MTTHQEVRLGCMHEEFKTIGDESVELIFADPPYGEGDKVAFNYSFDSKYKTIHEEWDRNDSGQIDLINETLIREAHRVLKPGGWLVLTCSNTNKLPLLSLLGNDQKAKATDDHFRFLNEVTFLKVNAIPFLHAKKLRRQAPCCEYVLFYGKGLPKTFNYEWLKTDRTKHEMLLVDQKRIEKTGKHPQMRDFWAIENHDLEDEDVSLTWNPMNNNPWMIPTDTRSYTPYEKDENGKAMRHPAQKPYRLLRRITLGFTAPGETILDPCCGSGAIGRLCKEYERNFIGFDVTQKYVELARKHLEDPAPIYLQKEREAALAESAS